MRDKKKFYIPKTTKYPQVGDINIKLLGKIATIPFKTFKRVGRFFKTESVVGQSSSIAGNIRVFIRELNKEYSFTPEKYAQVKNIFEFREIIGNKSEGSEGDILVHNSILNLDAIFKFSDWVASDDSWEITGLSGITTYEEDDAEDGYYVIMANGTTLIINPSDYSKVSNNWEQVDTITIPSEQENVDA